MACWTYEGVLLFGVVFISTLIFSILTQSASPTAADPLAQAIASRQSMQAFLMLVLTSYFVYFWRMGQTLAMKTWRIQLLSIDGSLPSTKQCLMRWVFTWVWFAPPLGSLMWVDLPMQEKAILTLGWIAVWATLSRFHSKKQFWHDAWAHTQLVNVQPTQTPPLAQHENA
jgi:uncharacterized RDD family membrane protein YckC